MPFFQGASWGCNMDYEECVWILGVGQIGLVFVIHLVRYEDNKNNKNTIMIVFCLHFVLFLFFEIANNPDVSMEHNKNSRTVVCKRKSTGKYKDSHSLVLRTFSYWYVYNKEGGGCCSQGEIAKRYLSLGCWFV